MNQTPLSPAERRQQFSRTVRIVLMILGGVILLFLLVLLGLYLFLPEKKTPESPGENYHFYPVLDENIFENQEYLAHDRTIYYWENPDGTGMRSPITDEDRSGFDAGVQFLEAMINTVICGDRFGYSLLFTEDYLRKNEIPEFTQQMLYDIEIRPYSTEALGDGRERTTYRLDYKILYNNGTYRRDVGSDAVRPQYVILLTEPDGSILIDGMYSYRVSP